MKPLSRSRPESHQIRAEKVCALRKAVQEGVYEVDSKKLANILVIQLLSSIYPAVDS
jgi:anti-sigma28 factor (negative regulator of flagellin synthesis)